MWYKVQNTYFLHQSKVNVARTQELSYLNVTTRYMSWTIVQYSRGVNTISPLCLTLVAASNISTQGW